MPANSSHCNHRRQYSATQQKLLKIRQKYKPPKATKKINCPDILAKPLRPQNIKINQHIVEEEAFGLKPYADFELQEYFLSKKPKPSHTYTQVKQSQVNKMLHGLQYMNNFYPKNKVIDLVEERKLSNMIMEAKESRYLPDHQIDSRRSQ